MCGNHVCVDSIGHEIKAIDHIMQRKMILSASEVGIDNVTLMHGWIIGYLNGKGDVDVFQKDLETEFAISRSTVTNILKLMEKKGYIERVSVKSDARLKKIILTEKGAEVFSLMHKVIDENERRFNNALNEEERAVFFDLIRKLRQGLESNK